MTRLARWGREQLRHFDPFEVAPSVSDIDFEDLWNLGSRGIIFDLENTIAPYRAEGLADGSLELLHHLRRRGFALGIVSNSRRSWVDAIATPLGIPFLGHAGKPRRAAFLEVIARMSVTVDQTVVVGDQRLTDVFGAQRIGAKAVLVDRLGPSEPWTSRAQRLLLPPALKLARRLLDSHSS
jgi:HAD superfamily phosphatase (TIGR01668 family)